MRRRDVDITGEAVGRLLPRLTPAAVLMTDDPDSAVRLLISALGAPGALASEDDARRSLARAVTHRPRWAGEQVIESRASQTWADEDAALAGAWGALTVLDRAAVVSGPEDDPVRGEATARLRGALSHRDADLRRERARVAALYQRPGSGAADEPPAPDVPDRLALMASERRLPAGAAETIGAAVATAHSVRRRRRLRVAAGVVTAAVLLVLVPLLPRGSAPPRPASVYAGPTRGSLAGDADFLRGIRDSGWALAQEERGPRRVIFAGDVPGDRWALVAAGGTPSRPATTAWFTGPANAPADQMSLLSIRVAPDPAEPVSVIDPTTGSLVVVAAAGDRVRLSDRPEIGAGGSVTRHFRSMPTSSGVAAVSLAPIARATVTPVRLQVDRHGRRLDVPPPTVVGIPGTPPLVVTPARLRPAPPRAPGDGAVEPRLRAVLGQLGEPVADTPVTTLWAGDLPGPNDQPARLTVLAIPQRSGAVVVTTPYGYAADLTGRAGSSWCGTGVLAAGPPLEQRVVAVECDLSDLGVEREIVRFLVVVAPRTATSMQLLDDTGAVLRERPLADGVAVVRSPGDVAQVSVTTADGGTVTGIPLTDADLSD